MPPEDFAPAARKRFFTSASIVEGAGSFAIALDGKAARTRAGHALASPSRALAGAIAAEWNGQRERIDFRSMPMTRLRTTVIDRGVVDAAEWRRATLAFLATDLLCYRASAPSALIERQAAAWDPILAWAATQGILLKVGHGVAFIEQPQASLDAAAAVLDSASTDALIAVKSAAEIAGSAIVAIALWRGAFPAAALFAASRTDETFQAEKWGHDADAEARASQMNREFLDAARYLSLIAAG
jgi:chaperone required for assembly of F1-ATPase